MKTILAAIDFSSVTQKVIDTAVNIAQPDSHIWLIHVEEIDGEPADYSAGPKSVRNIVANELKDMHSQLHNVAQEIMKQGLTVTPLLIQGVVVQAILEQCKKINADTLVVGSHGHNGLWHKLMGNVCEDLLSHTTIPLMIVPVKQQG